MLRGVGRDGPERSVPTVRILRLRKKALGARRCSVRRRLQPYAPGLCGTSSVRGAAPCVRTERRPGALPGLPCPALPCPGTPAARSSPTCCRARSWLPLQGDECGGAWPRNGSSWDLLELVAAAALGFGLPLIPSQSGGAAVALRGGTVRAAAAVTFFLQAALLEDFPISYRCLSFLLLSSIRTGTRTVSLKKTQLVLCCPVYGRERMPQALAGSALR